MQLIKFLFITFNLFFFNALFANTLIIEWDSYHKESLVAVLSVTDIKQDPNTINLKISLADDKEIPTTKRSKNNNEDVVSFIIERNDFVNTEDKVKIHLTADDKDIINLDTYLQLSGITVIKDNKQVTFNTVSLPEINNLEKLAELITTGFEQTTNSEQKLKIKKLTDNTSMSNEKAQVFFDLGTVAFEQNHIHLSNYLLLKATQLNKDSLLYQSWLVNSVKSLLNHRINKNVMLLLEQDFTDRINTQWNNHHKNPNEYPSPARFAVRNLVDLRLGLARLESDPTKKLAWFEKTSSKNLLPTGELQQKYKAPTSLFIKARVEVAQSNHYRDIARNHLRTFNEDPSVKQEKTLREQYEKAVKKANVLKDEVKKEYESKKKSAEITAIEDKINAIKKEDEVDRNVFNENKSKIAAIKEANTTVKRDFEAKENPTEKEALISQYNANVQKANKIAAENKALANTINGRNANIKTEYDKLNNSLKKLQNEVYAPYDKLVNSINNDLRPSLDKLTANLQQIQKPAKDAYKSSDLYFAKAKKLLKARKTSINEQRSVNKIKSLEKKLPLAELSSITLNNRPWCSRLSYYCDACFGLEVVNCELDQQKAIGHCNSGEAYNLHYKGYGSGGLIGSCKGIFIVAADTKLGHYDDYRGQMVYETYGDLIRRKHQASLMQDALAEFLGLASAGKPASKTDKEKLKKLLWRLMNESDPEIRGAGFLLSEIVELGEEEKEGNIKALFDSIENATDDKEKKFAVEKAADKLSGLLSHYIRGTDPTDLTSSDVENLTNIVKYGSFFADDLKNPNPLTAEKNGVSKLFTALHGVAAVYDGTKNQDGLVLVDGMRDLLDSVPNVSSNPALAPIVAVLDLPATTVASINKVNRDGFNQASSVLSDLSKGFSGDQAALDRAVKNSQKMEAILSPQNYVKTAVDGVKNRLLDKIPFARTVVSWFTSS